MSTLHITRGLPGAGKSHWARNWVAEDPATRSRCNRDDVGMMLHGGRFYGDERLFPPTEDAITCAQHAMVGALLVSGRDVVVDDTNLDNERLLLLLDVADQSGAEVRFIDMRGVPLATVLERNDLRAGTPGYVPEQVIRDKWERYCQPLHAA